MPNCFIQLGRNGDIINILPLIYHAHTQGQRATIMVQEEYAPLLEGVSYCDKLIWKGSATDVRGVYETAHKSFADSDIKITQVVADEETARWIYSRAGRTQATQESFCKEAWFLAGKLGLWEKQIPLVFDRRDPEREKALVEKVYPRTRGPRKKLMLVSLGGITAPFKAAKLCLKLLQSEFPRFHIVDLSQVKAERFYDLIGLYEQAHVLVSSDSAPLHLAYAVKTLPVVALINDSPSLWNGSPWRPAHIFHCRYKDWTERAVEMISTIKNIGCRNDRFSQEVNGKPAVVHIWSEYESPERTRYPLFKNWIDCPVKNGTFGRNSKNKIQCEKRYPFVPDVIRAATMLARDKDVICLSKNSVRFESGAEKLMLEKGCGYHLRRYRDKDEYHPAADMFFFTKEWWLNHRREYPDMILDDGMRWGQLLMELIKRHGGVELKEAIWQ